MIKVRPVTPKRTQAATEESIVSVIENEVRNAMQTIPVWERCHN